MAAHEVQFILEDKNPQGKVTSTQVLIESGFDNQGQAEAWLAVGARQRYGATFWHRVAKIKVVEAEPHCVEQVDPPPFYAGGV